MADGPLDAQELSDPMEVLAGFAVSARPGADALEMMRLSLFDWAACAISGAREPVAAILRRVEGHAGGAAQSSVIGLEARLPSRAAALINGTTSHALDYDDTHFGHIGHPSVAVLPAALALAEATQASGTDLLTSATVGAEASIRVGLWLGRAHYETGFHQTATAGAFGATVAAGRLLGLSEPQMIHALGLAATRAAGLKSQFGTMGKPYNAGLAAETGVQAAMLAAAGMVSAPHALGGAQGFGPTHAGQAEASAWDGLGIDWHLTTISHKFHACCHGLHAMLEALTSVKLAPDAIDRVTIVTHPRWMSVCNQPEPRTGLEAKFSYRLTAAMGLVGWDTGALETYSAAACRDPVLLSLRERVNVIATERLTETQAEVFIDAGPRSHTLRYDLRQPMSLEDRTAKLRRKVTSLLGDGAEPLWQATANPVGIDLTAIAALLRAAPTS